MSQPIIENQAFITWYDRRGFYHTMVKPGAEITLELARENTEAIKQLCDGLQHPILVDLRKMKEIHRDAMEHFSLQGKRRLVNGIALLVSSPLSRITGNFFISLKRPTVETRLFPDEEKAVVWLEKLVVKNGKAEVVLD